MGGLELIYKFKSVARARYGGSLGAAWHAALDIRRSGRVGYLDFVRGGRALGFTGNYKKLWEVLMETSGQDSEGFIYFETFDPHSFKMLERFRTQFLDLGVTTLDDLWENHLDRDGSGRCLREEFLTTMVGFGWDVSVAKQLFRMIDVGRQQDLSLDELEILGLPRRLAAQTLTGQELLRLQAQQAREKVLSDFHGYLVRSFGS